MSLFNKSNSNANGMALDSRNMPPDLTNPNRDGSLGSTSDRLHRHRNARRFSPSSSQQRKLQDSKAKIVNSLTTATPSAEDMADAFSSSLANIAAAGVRRSIAKQQQRMQQSQQQQPNRGIKRKSAYDEANVRQGDTGGAYSSSGSSGRRWEVVNCPAQVSTSSGEDRDSYTASADDSRVNSANPLDTSLMHHHQYVHREHHKVEEKVAQHSRSITLDGRVHEHTAVVAHLTPRHVDGCNSSESHSHESIFDDRAGADPGALLPPYREPCFHTIRTTFNKFAKRDPLKAVAKIDSHVEAQSLKRKHKSKRTAIKDDPPKKRTAVQLGRDVDEDNAGDDSGGSSGSGTEGGYAASSSSNGHEAKQGSFSSPSSEESSEDSGNEHQKHVKAKFSLSGDPTRPMLSKKQEITDSVSSEIADFSSSTSSVAESYTMDAFDARSESPSISSTSSGDPSDDEDQVDNKAENIIQSTQRVDMPSGRHLKGPSAPSWLEVPLKLPGPDPPIRRKKRVSVKDQKNSARVSFTNNSGPTIEGKPPIMALGCDVMAHVLTFLQPPDILDVLTMPLSKDWLFTFTRQPELWRVLCLLEPFKAKVEVEDSNEWSDDSDFPFKDNSGKKQAFGKFRLLYTSFVRCMKYLVRIKDDAVNGRPPSIIDFGTLDGPHNNISANRNLQHFLSRARGVVDEASQAPAASTSGVPPVVEQCARAAPVNLSDEESLSNNNAIPKKKSNRKSIQKNKVRYGHSKLTQRLLGPAPNGSVKEVELPWSCGIFSIVNWMVAFDDVEGIQTMCLKVLPFLLENEQQRITAQRAGLTDIVLRAMVLFPDSAPLHSAAFHTIVLLARPLGGQEGMLFHTSMVNSSGIFSQEGNPGGRNGIAVLLDSMRRFQHDSALQSMSCWSLVNIALAPAQKEVLVKLGGIEVTAKAMMEHPYDAEVQFRALFALINLVIPSVSINQGSNNEESEKIAEDDQSEREMLDEMVTQIVHLVVLAMKNFCSNEAILNRACLVLHNLSLTPDYHEAILWTPNCYQMLEWCLGNYRTDQVLQQSAAGTLHRLQMTLSRNDALRARFAASIQAQQQQSLEQAHREAIMLHEHQALQEAADGESVAP